MSDVMLNKMLPSSIDDNETIKIINEILQPYIDQNFKVFIPRLFLYANIDRLDENMLNHLAYECHVDFYDVDLPIEKKRIMVKKALKYHRYKGTPFAVEELLSDVFDDTWIKEWFEYGGDPYYFRIYTKDFLKDEKTFRDFMKALFAVKNTRSWLEGIVLVREHHIYYGMYGQKAKHYEVLPNKVEDKEFENKIFMGMAIIQKKIKRTAIMPDVWILNDNEMFLEVGDGSGVPIKYD